jgi:hypothetical protein
VYEDVDEDVDEDVYVQVYLELIRYRREEFAGQGDFLSRIYYRAIPVLPERLR